MTESTLLQAIKIQDWIRDLQMDFHRHPELSYDEYRTSGIVRSELEKLGIKTTALGKTGVSGMIHEKSEGRVVALRADMDALPITEATGLPFSSENAGIMHACGHDTHTAMLLGAARLLTEIKEEFKGTVKLVFQPAEEDGTGAKSMIDNGILANPTVDAIVGMHIFTDYPCGKIVVQKGPLMASGDQFRIEIYGKQCHGSAPWQGVDANVCAAAIIQGVQTIVSRKNDARSPIVVNIGKIEGGDRFNVTSGKVVIEGSNRTFNEETRNLLPSWIENMVKGTCIAYGCEYKFEYMPRCAVVINDAETTDKIKNAMVKMLGRENVLPTEMIMGSEDFSIYQHHVKGTFILLGAGNSEKDCVYSLHSDHFRFDENALPIGAAGYAEAALACLKDE